MKCKRYVDCVTMMVRRKKQHIMKDRLIMGSQNFIFKSILQASKEAIEGAKKSKKQVEQLSKVANIEQNLMVPIIDAMKHLAL